MTPEMNKKFISNTLDEIYNKGNFNLADRTHAATCVIHDPLLPGLPVGPDAAKQYARTMRETFPDLHLEIENIIAENEFVAVRFRATGTQKGTFLGIAPTGKFGSVSGLDFFRIENDRIAEAWVHWDVITMLRDVGVELPITIEHVVHV